ncbi:hypothetical protein KP79_PYT09459 [Mizuhopecten yessoensis]|nr:hypothetical protein KP79_PYT09459 [Mizuhopecten yessoensis]
MCDVQCQLCGQCGHPAVQCQRFQAADTSKPPPALPPGIPCVQNIQHGPYTPPPLSNNAQGNGIPPGGVYRGLSGGW